MNKKLYGMMSLFLLSMSICGCSKALVFDKENNRIQAPLLAMGPAASLAKIDEEIMKPILAVTDDNTGSRQKLEQVEQSKQILQCVQKGNERLAKETVMRLNDKYLFFAKRYLKTVEQYLLLSQKANYENNDTVAQLMKFQEIDLEDARMAFLRSRALVAGQKDSYNLGDVQENQFHKGMSYVQIRKLLNMPGEHLDTFTIPSANNTSVRTIEPVLWASNSGFLYVEFEKGKCTSWKLKKPTVFEGKVRRKVRKQISQWHEDIVQPAWNLYQEYLNNRRVLEKQKIYNEAAARKQKDWLKLSIPKLSNYRKQLSVISSDEHEIEILLSDASKLLSQLEERLKCAYLLADDGKDKQTVINYVNQGNHLEHWEIWRSWFVYNNTMSWLKEGKTSYRFPKWANGLFPKKPWHGSLMHWFMMPGEMIHRHYEMDTHNSKKLNRHDTWLWVQGDSYFYGCFVNDRLVSWKQIANNDGMYHEK